MLNILLVETGETDTALREVDRLAKKQFDEIPRNLLWLPNVAMLAELSATLKHHHAANDLYNLLLPYADWNVSGGGNVISYGAVAYYLGKLSTTLERWDEAARHFHTAIKVNERMNARPFIAWSHFEIGRLLMSEATVGREDRAARHLEQAAEIAGLSGMRRLLVAQECLMKHESTMLNSRTVI